MVAAYKVGACLDSGRREVRTQYMQSKADWEELYVGLASNAESVSANP